MSLEQLKAMAYDCIAQTQQVQRNLELINQEIALRNQPIPPVAVKEESKEEAETE